MWDLGSREWIQGLGLRVSGFWLLVYGLWILVNGLGFRVKREQFHLVQARRADSFRFGDPSTLNLKHYTLKFTP